MGHNAPRAADRLMGTGSTLLPATFPKPLRFAAATSVRGKSAAALRCVLNVACRGDAGRSGPAPCDSHHLIHAPVRCALALRHGTAPNVDVARAAHSPDYAAGLPAPPVIAQSKSRLGQPPPRLAPVTASR